jgi:predicted cation transporter
MSFVEIGLFIILLLVLTLPFFVHRIEREIEIFLFIMGALSVTLTSQWHLALIHEALVEPVKITLAVFVAGFVFNLLQHRVAKHVNKAAHFFGIKLFAFGIIFILGLLSSVITAIVAALVLVEIISSIRYDRKLEIRVVVCACFAIGFGAALTPIGEPLSTIVVAKLRGEPYHAGFFFLLSHMWYYIVPGIIVSALLGAFFSSSHTPKKKGLHEDRQESLKDIVIRSLKVYLFIIALVLLGTGFKPIVDAHISKIPYQGLYWLNMISAVLDNATLAAAEVGTSMSLLQIKSTLLGLLIAGGMLIPGNIPNIISAGKLKIRSREWAVIGVPVGLVIMIAYFIVILLH